MVTLDGHARAVYCKVCSFLPCVVYLCCTHRDFPRLLVGAHVDVEQVGVEVEGVVLLVHLRGSEAEPEVAAAALG